MLKTNEAGEEYTALAYETCKKRITLAGYRLANIIIDIYKSSSSERNNDESVGSKLEKTWETIKNDVSRVNYLQWSKEIEQQL